MPLTLPRRVTFVAKAEYFTTPGHQGLVPEEVLLRRRPGADRPVRRLRRRGRAVVGAQAILERGRAVRDLPRGHPLARRPALPRQDRRRPAGPGDRVPGDPGRGARHRRGGAAGQEVRHLHPAGRALRQAAGLLPLRGHGERPLHPARRSPTRSCTRSCSSPARSTSTSTPPRPRSCRRSRRPTAKRAEREARDELAAAPASRSRHPDPAPAAPGPADGAGRDRGRGPPVPLAGGAALRARSPTRWPSTSTGAASPTRVGAACVLAGMVGLDRSWSAGPTTPTPGVRRRWVVADLVVALAALGLTAARQGARLPLDGAGLLGDGRDVRVGHPLARDRRAGRRRPALGRRLR